MSGIAQVTEGDYRRTVVRVSEFSIWLTVSLTTVAGVGTVLMRAPASAHRLALPVFVLGAAAMFGLGLVDTARGRELSFARALIGAGVLWSLSALTASQDPLAYSVGRVSQWLVDLAIAYLLLSYPSGRLEGTTERALFAGLAALVGLLFLPTALMGPFPHPSPWSTCISACPRNAFSLGHSTALVQDVVIPLREVLAVAGFAAIATTLIQRARKAAPMLGQFYVPIASLAVLQAAVFTAYFPLRAVVPDSDAVAVVSWIFVLSLPAIGLGCGTGGLYRRTRATNMLERMAGGLTASSSAGDVRRALANALQDPSVRILHSFPGDFRAWFDLEIAEGPGIHDAAIANQHRAIANNAQFPQLPPDARAGGTGQRHQFRASNDGEPTH